MEISGRLGVLTMLITRRGAASLAQLLLQQIDQVFGIAQVGEIGEGGDNDFVGLQQDALDRWGPGVRQIDGHVGHVLAHDIEHEIAGVGEIS